MSPRETNPFEGLSEPLLAVTGPDLFRVNAFRILGLAVNATERSIKKQSEKVQLMEKFGGAEAMRTVGPMPLNPVPDVDAIREAIHRLRDPERRLIDEVFWFWPGQAGGDPALTALATGDIKTATEYWYGRIGHDEHGIATHNVAVMYLAAALDLECIPEVKPLSVNLRKLQSAYWMEAFARWRLTLKDERFWQRLNARVRELNDPRLTTELTAQLRRTLPLALLLINAQLAARAVEQGDAREAERQRQLMRASGFDEATVEEALRRAVQPFVAQLRAMCGASEPEAEADPRHADGVTGRLLERSGVLLAAIESLLPQGDTLPAELRDEVAACALKCLVPYGQEPGTWRAALDLLARARPLAGSSGVRERMDDMRAFLLRAAYQPESVKAGD